MQSRLAGHGRFPIVERQHLLARNGDLTRGAVNLEPDEAALTVRRGKGAFAASCHRAKEELTRAGSSSPLQNRTLQQTFSDRLRVLYGLLIEMV